MYQRSASYGMPPPPCAANCEERSELCHATCDRYTDWAEERRRRIAQIQEKREAESRIIEHITKNKRKFRR